MLLSLLTLTSALNCAKVNLEFLDKGFFLETKRSTPPSTTDVKIYFNPCSPVEGNSACSSDDHFCVVESIKNTITAVKPFGSKNAGANEYFSLSGSDEDGGKDDDSLDQPDLHLAYQGATWGDTTLNAFIAMYCRDKKIDPTFDNSFADYTLKLYGPEFCITSDEPSKGDKGGQNNNNDGGSIFGFFFGLIWWLFKVSFFLALIGGILFLVKTVYVNYGQQHGSLPVSPDLRDIIADLPYLLRDAFRKVTSLFTDRGSQGYSAL